jgi:hypothetical protein
VEEDDLPIADLIKRKKQTPTSPSKRRMLIQDKTIPDLMDDDHALIESSDDESTKRMDTGSRCSAGDFCYNGGDKWVVLKGDGKNGSECSECKKEFHHVCLFLFQERVYCLKCYNEYVVSNCSTETLFQDLFQVEDQVEEEVEESAPEAKHTESQLVMFVDNYLMSKGYKMTFGEYHEWRRAGFQFIKSKPVLKKKWDEGEKRERQKKDACN